MYERRLQLKHGILLSTKNLEGGKDS